MWIIYANATHPDSQTRGQIDLIFDGKEVAAQQCVGDYQSMIEGEADPQLQYVDAATFEVVDKTALAANLSADTVVADGTSEVVLAGLPMAFTVSVNGEEVEVDDGSLEFSTDAPGSYFIQCQAAKYIAESYTVYAI